MSLSLLSVVAWTTAVALIGRETIPGGKPGLAWATLCAFAGWIACFAAARALQQEPAGLHPFEAECFLPAIAATAGLLALGRCAFGRRGLFR